MTNNVWVGSRVGLDRGFDVFDDELTAPDVNRPHVLERLAPDATERALAWLRDTEERPFFLWVHYQDPHGPYTPPPELAVLRATALGPAAWFWIKVPLLRLTYTPPPAVAVLLKI